MHITIIPTEEEIMKLIPRRTGVTITIDKYHVEIDGLDQLEQDKVETDIKALYGKVSTD